MKTLRFLALAAGLLFIAAPRSILAGNDPWKHQELYQAARNAYAKNDWKTALIDFVSFFDENLGRFQTVGVKADDDFKAQLIIAIEDCAKNIPDDQIPPEYWVIHYWQKYDRPGAPDVHDLSGG